MSRRNQNPPLCWNFQRGSCSYGANCKFAHSLPSGAKQPEHSCKDPKSCKERIVEDWKGEAPVFWRLTCYAHWKQLPNDVSGDVSFEELRALVYDGAKQGVPLRELAQRENALFRAREAEFQALQKNSYQGPFNQSNSFLKPAETRTIFGKPVPANSLLSPAPSSGGFRNVTGPQYPLFQPATFTPPTQSPTQQSPFFNLFSPPTSTPPAPVVTQPQPSPFGPFNPTPQASPFPPPTSSSSPFFSSPGTGSLFPNPTVSNASPGAGAGLLFPNTSPGSLFSNAPKPVTTPTLFPSTVSSSPSAGTGQSGEVDSIWQRDWELGQIPEEEPPVTVR